MAGTVYQQGRLRPGGQRPWRVTAYVPDATYPYGRVRFKLPSGAWTQRVPRPGQTVDDVFEEVEKGLGDVNLTHKAPVRRDIDALADRYDEWMVDNLEDTTITKNRNILSKWVRPIIGQVLVIDWAPEHTRKVRKAVGHLSKSRVEDVGTVLSGLRTIAHEKTTGGRWLAETENPMAGVSFTKKHKIAGQHERYVEPSKRPTDKQVAAAIEASRIRGELIGVPTLPLLTGIACKVGLRQGENFALRGVDVDELARLLDVNGSWCQPRGHNGKKPYRKPTKTNTTRKAPFPQSLAAAVAARLAELRASEDGVEGWLVPDTRTGMPWNKETFNDEWHRIQRLTKTLAAERPDLYEAWPRRIPFRNARHYCATWWKRKGLDWEEIADFLGNSYQTCLNYYVRAADDAEQRARRLLEND